MECLPGYSSLKPTTPLNSAFLKNPEVKGCTHLVDTWNLGTRRALRDYTTQPAVYRWESEASAEMGKVTSAPGQWQVQGGNLGPSLPVLGSAIHTRLPSPRTESLCELRVWLV